MRRTGCGQREVFSAFLSFIRPTAFAWSTDFPSFCLFAAIDLVLLVRVRDGSPDFPFAQLFISYDTPSGANCLHQDTNVAERQNDETAAVLYNGDDPCEWVDCLLEFSVDEKAFRTLAHNGITGRDLVAPSDEPLDDGGQDGDGDEHQHVPPAGRVAVIPHHHQVTQHGDGDDDCEADAPGDDEKNSSQRAQCWRENFDLYKHNDWQPRPHQVVDAENGDEDVDNRVQLAVQQDCEDNGEVQDRRQRHDDEGERHQDVVHECGPPVALYTSGTYQSGDVVLSGPLVTLQVLDVLQTAEVMDSVQSTLRGRRHTVLTPPLRPL